MKQTESESAKRRRNFSSFFLTLSVQSTPCCLWRSNKISNWLKLGLDFVRISAIGCYFGNVFSWALSPQTGFSPHWLIVTSHRGWERTVCLFQVTERYTLHSACCLIALDWDGALIKSACWHWILAWVAVAAAMAERRSKKEKEIVNEFENHMRGKCEKACCSFSFVLFCYVANVVSCTSLIFL
jgi:hypothetical protein